MSARSRKPEGAPRRPALAKAFAVWTALLFLFPFWPGTSGRGETAARPMTLLIYMCGSDLEDPDGFGSMDFLEITERVSLPQGATVLILTGGCQTWAVYGESEKTQIHLEEVTARGHRRIDSPAGLPSRMNMGDPETLAWFIDFGLGYAPAEETALILWDHGGGPMIGICRDDLYDKDMLSLEELTSALSGGLGSRRLSWIGFDACLMSSLEVAEAMTPFADYMIASEETEPGSSWDYTFLNDLSRQRSPGELGKAIVDRYIAQPLTGKPLLTLSCLDLSGAGEICAAADELFRTVLFRLNSNTFSQFSNKRRSSLDIGRDGLSSDYDLVDLFHYCAAFGQEAPEQVQRLREAIDQFVYYRGNLPNACGLSIYSPWYNQSDFQGSWQQTYRAMGILPSYSQYLDRYAGIWLGEALADWHLPEGLAPAPSAEGSQPVLLDLTDDQLTHFSSAKVVILRDTGSRDTYLKIFEISDVPLNGHTLTAEYRYEGLYAVNEKGQLITDSYPFEKDGDYYYVNAQLESEPQVESMRRLRSDPEASVPASRNVRLAFQKAEDSSKLELRNIIYYDDDESIQLGRQILSFNTEAWPSLYFIESNLPVRLTRDGEDQILPVSRWTHVVQPDFRTNALLDADGNLILSDQEKAAALSSRTADEYRLWGEVGTAENWSLQLLPQHMSGMDLYAQVIVTDTQGNETATELIPLHNPSVLASYPQERVILSGERAELLLQKAEVVRSPLDSGLALRFEVSNPSRFTYRLHLYDITVNDISLPDGLHSYQLISPRSEERIYIRLPAEQLPPLRDGIIHSLGFSASLITDEKYWDSDGKLVSASLTSAYTSIPLEADLSGLELPREEAEPETVLGEREENGLLFQLTRLQEADDGSISGTLRLENRSDRPLSLEPDPFPESGASLPAAVVNRHFLANTLIVSGLLSVQPHSSLSTDFRLLRAPAADGFGWETGNGSPADLPDYWSIESIESFGLLYSLYDGEENTGLFLTDIPLKTPLALRASSGSGSEGLTLVREQSTALQLRSVRKRLKSLELLMDLRNQGEAPLLLYAACRIDGKKASVSIHRETDAEAAEIVVFPWGLNERVLLEVSLPWTMVNQSPDSLTLEFLLQRDDWPDYVHQEVTLSLTPSADGKTFSFERP